MRSLKYALMLFQGSIFGSMQPIRQRLRQALADLSSKDIICHELSNSRAKRLTYPSKALLTFVPWTEKNLPRSSSKLACSAKSLALFPFKFCRRTLICQSSSSHSPKPLPRSVLLPVSSQNGQNRSTFTILHSTTPLRKNPIWSKHALAPMSPC
jgi:hypothetical protein